QLSVLACRHDIMRLHLGDCTDVVVGDEISLNDGADIHKVALDVVDLPVLDAAESAQDNVSVDLSRSIQKARFVPEHIVDDRCLINRRSYTSRNLAGTIAAEDIDLKYGIRLVIVPKDYT